MPKKKKNKIKIKKLKSEEERVSEVIHVFKQLRDFGLSSNDENIKKFREICNDYIKDGLSRSGKIKLLGFKRIIEYNLQQLDKHTVSVNLKYNKEV